MRSRNTGHVLDVTPNWTFETTWMPLRDGRTLPRYPDGRLVKIGTDLFHPDIPNWVIDEAIAIISKHRQHTFRLTTRYPDRARTIIHDIKAFIEGQLLPFTPMPNFWLGLDVQAQADLDWGWPIIQDVPCAVRYLEIGDVGPDFNLNVVYADFWRGLDWVLVSGKACSPTALVEIQELCLGGEHQPEAERRGVPLAYYPPTGYRLAQWPRGWKPSPVVTEPDEDGEFDGFDGSQ